MSAGFQSVYRRLQPVSADQTRDISNDIEFLLEVLHQFFFTGVHDEIDREQRFTDFVIPSTLHALHPHLYDDAHRIRFNEYLFMKLSGLIPDSSVRESAVLGLLAAIIDFGSVADQVLEADFISGLVFDIFPDLRDFLNRVSIETPVFKSVGVNLTSLASFLDSIQASHSNTFLVHHEP